MVAFFLEGPVYMYIFFDERSYLYLCLIYEALFPAHFKIACIFNEKLILKYSAVTLYARMRS
jgi:hypothetical protein